MLRTPPLLARVRPVTSVVAASLAVASLINGRALSAATAIASGNDPSLVTLERIFKTKDFQPERFGPARWLQGGAAYTTLESTTGLSGTSPATGPRELIRYDTASGRREVLVSLSQLTPRGASSPIEIADYSWSEDGRRLLVFTNTKRVWRANSRGDYWVLDRVSGDLRKLGRDAPRSTLMFAKFTPDGRRVGYVRENDIYVEDIEGGRVVRLTSNGSPTLINGAFDWVYEEELGLRDGFRFSPDGRRVAFWQSDASLVKEFTLIDNTSGLYPTLTRIPYPKAGETNSAVRIGVVPSEGGEPTFLNVPGDPREQYLARMEWAGSGELMVQRLNRLQNTLDVMLADAATGAVRTVLSERDDTWVDVEDDFHWLDKGRRFLWLSERDGWRRAYSFPRDGGAPTPLTAAGVDVMQLLAVDEPGGHVYYMASPTEPTRRYLFRARLDGASPAAERITPVTEPGTHSYQMSPDARFAIHTVSRFETPPVTDLVRLQSHVRLRALAANEGLRGKVEALRRAPVEFFRVEIEKGVELDGWRMKPPAMAPGKRYPLLMHVYGEPAAQTVLDRWGGNNHLWHQMLAQQGYVVVSVDNRGTPSPRGRAWRKSIYRQIGILASQDQAAAVRKILEWPYIDAERVGSWGWSGGGQMTLNAMFRYPELYKTGIAVAFVADQRLYDTIYQERFMARPQDNPEGYRLGSPITFADRLQGNLLIVHGTGDDNVHYQSTEKLVNALVAAGKRFTMMAYPNRAHGISEGEGTSLHLYDLMTNFLERNLRPGPRSD